MPYTTSNTQCRHCERNMPPDSWYEERWDGGEICESCRDLHYICCDGCEETYRSYAVSYSDMDGCYYCESCRPDAEVNDPSRDQEQPEILEPSNELTFKPRKFGKMRGTIATSVELEFTGSGDLLASRLYDLDLSNSRSMDNYSAEGRGRSCVKSDGSISYGGELVISMVALPGRDETARLWRTMDELRKLVHGGDNGLDTQCGCHIHVDARGLRLTEVASTIVAFGYLEDILYRIGAAKYSKGHRVLSGNSYTGLTPKHFSKDRTSFRASFAGERYTGLNVSNWVGARYNCACGVGFDNGHLCTCRPRKNTIELRLFNATANPIKLQAYIALSQALVAYGRGRDLTPGDLGSPLEFTETSQVSNSTPEDYAGRIEWMFRNLPMSREERDAIRYCLRNCDIAQFLGQAVVNGRLTTEGVAWLLDNEDTDPIDDSAWDTPKPARRPRAMPARNSRGQFATQAQIVQERTRALGLTWETDVAASMEPAPDVVASYTITMDHYEPEASVPDSDPLPGCNCWGCTEGRLRQRDARPF